MEIEKLKKKKWYRYYAKHSILPIEVYINTILLYRNQRSIVQFDMTYYGDDVKAVVDEFANCLKYTIQHKDDAGNLVLYMKKKRKTVEKKLRKISRDDTVRGAFKTCEYAQLLDNQFYVCKTNIQETQTHTDIVRVAIEVIAPQKYYGKIGAILVMMCIQSDVKSKITSIYKRFIKISKVLSEIDSSFQSQLCFYTKPGIWKSTPEFINKSVQID